MQKRLFPYVGAKLWNKIPTYIRNQPTLGSFSKEVLKFYKLQPSPYLKNLQKLYNLGDRATNIAHTCLRLGYSKLNSHLKKNMYVRECESCLCGFPNEDPDHFFISCPLYDANIRHNLLESLHFIQGQITINANLLLYGSRNLKYDQNKVIFNAAHRFIAQSKRF